MGDKHPGQREQPGHVLGTVGGECDQSRLRNSVLTSEVTGGTASQSLGTVVSPLVFLSVNKEPLELRLECGWRVVGEHGGVPHREVSYRSSHSRAQARALVMAAVERGQLQVCFDSRTNRRNFLKNDA